MLGFRPQMPWSAAPAEPLCDAAAAVVVARRGMETPLTAEAEEFEELAHGMDADGGELRLAPFGDTCALVYVLFSCLGIAFKFSEIEEFFSTSPRGDVGVVDLERYLGPLGRAWQGPMLPSRDERRCPSSHNLQHNAGAIESFLPRFPTAAGAGASWR